MKETQPPAWKKITTHDGDFFDGQKFLVAIEVKHAGRADLVWEYHLIQASGCSEEPLSFNKIYDEDSDYTEPFTAWEWGDLDYYIEIKE